MLPSEAIERILSFCDGKTLYNARHVNHNWSQLVDYLTVKTDIWKYCCYEEIPTDQLIEYLEKFNVSPSSNKYKDIYENWLAWQNVTDNIDFDIMLCPADIPRITCLAASGRFIAVGSEDGKVRLYNDSWDLLYTTRHVAVKVLEITFFDDDRDLYMGDVWPVIIISYKCSTLYLMDYEDRFIDPLIVHDVKLYRNEVRCLKSKGGKLTYYCPDCSDFKGQLKNFQNLKPLVKELKNELDLVKEKVVSTQNVIALDIETVIQEMADRERPKNITLQSNDKNRQLMELFILGSSREYSKKLFHPWEVLESYITCMYLYGNTFILGVDVGDVYIYNVDSWKTFDIRKYQEKIRIGKHPIISIDVLEKNSERKFFIASSFNIHRVVGFSIVKF
ncbi:f-box-like domain superfamily [Holotrichia oblita]|uniref:F-box-like domain superfamily n=1 Tax=Holotrichia oblita TaxID=644536 RepID=A0ACB9T980_HOLOL|nr:f-box-like domain superfamily [Holotrichia oblita]